MKQKPILVTGTHRSGSTWLGHLIANSKQVCYIHEPFNLKNKKAISNINWEYWFTYICKENEDLYFNQLQKTTNFSYSFKGAFSQLNSKTGVKYFFKTLYDFEKAKILFQRPLLKDPIAFFSTEWLQERFDVQPIILIRHPAAFVSSLKRVNWTFDFGHFLNQPLLMENKLGKWEYDIIKAKENKVDIIDQGILIWNIFHDTIKNYQKDHPDWFYIKHELLANEPELYLKEIFSYLNLPYTSKIKNYIRATTNSNNPIEATKTTQYIRNSKSIVKNWKNKLSQNELERISEGTRDVAINYYNESEW